MGCGKNRKGGVMKITYAAGLCRALAAALFPCASFAARPTIKATPSAPPNGAGWYTSTGLAMALHKSNLRKRFVLLWSVFGMAWFLVSFPLRTPAQSVPATTDFKIRSWQTNPQGDPLQTGKCLDYGVSPIGNGATVFL